MTDKPKGIPKKRNRIPVSCESCRIRKLKCDRQRPCLNCTSRNLECVFVNGVPSKRSSLTGAVQSEDLRSKLQRLEAIVSAMAETSSTQIGPPTSSEPVQQETPDSDSHSRSSLEADNQNSRLYTAVNGHHYIGGSHWETIIQEISSIREQYEEEVPYTIQDRVPYLISRNPALLSGALQGVSLVTLVEDLPNRVLADRLISRYFEYYDLGTPSRETLHRPTFTKAFDQFWGIKETGFFCPSALGTYYAVFAIALLSYNRNNDEPSDLRGKCLEMADNYRKSSAQCLMRADIGAPTRTSVECLLLQIICEQARSSDGYLGQWMLLGLLIRKALHMGFHRDPSEFPSLSPFEGEMRRRLWAYIWQFDMLFAFQLGLPLSLQPQQSNVAPPLNVYEEELSEDMKHLPPSRPMEESTKILYMIAKIQLMKTLSAVVQHMNTLQTCSLEDIDSLNIRLRAAYDMIPSQLRMKPMKESLAEPRSIRLKRVQLQILFDKATCIINRRFIARCDANRPNNLRPRELCVQSALSILQIQEIYEHEQCKWWMMHFIKQDIFLANAILFLVLFTNQKQRQQNLRNGASIALLDQEDRTIRAALDRSQAIWEAIEDVCNEAKSAGRMFNNMRSKLESGVVDPASQPAATQPLSQSTEPMDTQRTADDVKDEVMNDAIVDTGLGQFNPLSSTYDFDWSAWEVTLQQDGLDNLDSFWPTGADAVPAMQFG